MWCHKFHTRELGNCEEDKICFITMRMTPKNITFIEGRKHNHQHAIDPYKLWCSRKICFIKVYISCSGIPFGNNLFISASNTTLRLHYILSLWVYVGWFFHVQFFMIKYVINYVAEKRVESSHRQLVTYFFNERQLKLNIYVLSSSRMVTK